MDVLYMILQGIGILLLGIGLSVLFGIWLRILWSIAAGDFWHWRHRRPRK